MGLQEKEHDKEIRKIQAEIEAKSGGNKKIEAEIQSIRKKERESENTNRSFKKRLDAATDELQYVFPRTNDRR